MLLYILKRILYFIPTFFIIALFTFLLSAIAPGDHVVAVNEAQRNRVDAPRLTLRGPRIVVSLSEHTHGNRLLTAVDTPICAPISRSRSASGELTRYTTGEAMDCSRLRVFVDPSDALTSRTAARDPKSVIHSRNSGRDSIALESRPTVRKRHWSWPGQSSGMRRLPAPSFREAHSCGSSLRCRDLCGRDALEREPIGQALLEPAAEASRKRHPRISQSEPILLL